jgi:uncharacterized protein YjbJ (UPF0337 family)
MQVRAGHHPKRHTDFIAPSDHPNLRSARGANFHRKGVPVMDKDRIKGTVKKAEGAVKEQIGKLTGNESLETEGKVEQVEGAIQNAFGKAKDILREG